MTRQSFALFDRMQELTMTTSRVALAFAAVSLTAPAALAQTSVSTFTLPVSGTVSAAAAGLPEAVAFSGNVVIIATVVTDPALPPNVVVAVDGRGVTGVGQKTKAVYKNECEANLTRRLLPADKVQLTFAFFKDGAGSHLSTRTGLLTLNLTYDTTRMALTSVTGGVAPFIAAAQ